jgi:hypothetical protein
MKFPELDDYDKRLISVVIGFVVFAFIFIFFVFKFIKNQHNQCKQAGGVYVATRHNYVCLRPDAVIEMKEVE